MLSALNARRSCARVTNGVLDADLVEHRRGTARRDRGEPVVEAARMAAGGNALMTMLGGTAGRLIADEGRTGQCHRRTQPRRISQVRRQVRMASAGSAVMVTD